MHERKQRSDAGHLVPMPRDERVLTWIAEQYTATFNQVQRLLVLYSEDHESEKTLLSDTATRNALTRWQTLGFIEEPRRLWYQYKSFIWLARAGLVDLGLPYRPYTPKRGQLHHLVAVNEVRLSIQGAHSADLWIPRRTLLTAHELERKRQVSDPNAEPERTVFPDAFLALGEQDQHIAVLVVERVRQQHDVLTITQGLLEHYPAVRYYVCSDMLQVVQEIRATLPLGDHLDLYDLMTMRPFSEHDEKAQSNAQTVDMLPDASCQSRTSNPVMPGKSKIKAAQTARKPSA